MELMPNNYAWEGILRCKFQKKMCKVKLELAIYTNLSKYIKSYFGKCLGVPSRYAINGARGEVSPSFLKKEQQCPDFAKDALILEKFSLFVCIYGSNSHSKHHLSKCPHFNKLLLPPEISGCAPPILNRNARFNVNTAFADD